MVHLAGLQRVGGAQSSRRATARHGCLLQACRLEASASDLLHAVLRLHAELLLCVAQSVGLHAVVLLHADAGLGRCAAERC